MLLVSPVMAHWSKVTPEEFHNSSIQQSINVPNTQCQVGRQGLSQSGIRERIKRYIKNDLRASFLNSPMAGTELVSFWVDRSELITYSGCHLGH